MARIPARLGVRVAGLILAGAMLAGCEDMVYAIQDHPKAVRMLTEREVMIVDRQF